MSVINYSKWDAMLYEEDKRPTYKETADVHQESTALISKWIREACPKIKSSETRRLINFITVQHHNRQPTNVSRAGEICAFIDKTRDEGAELDMQKLIALTKLAKKMSEHEEEGMREKAKRVLGVAMGALNTLAAVTEVGKASWLFDMLHDEPNGEVMKKYKELGYAIEAVHAPPPDPRALPTDWNSWCQKLWKGVLLQTLMVGVFGAIAYPLIRYFGPDWDTMGENVLAAAGLQHGHGQPPLRPTDNSYQGWGGRDPDF